MADSIRVAAQARCTPDLLWHTLVENRAAWWPELDFTASPGAPLTERAADGGAQRASGTVLAVARNRLLSFRWTMPGWNAQHTVVSILLDGDGGAGADSSGAEHTDVVVTESGLGTLAASADVARTHTAEWADRLADLVKLAEDGAGA